jgi:hypothetical protein
MRPPGAIAIGLAVATVAATTIFQVGDTALAAAGLGILGLLVAASAPRHLPGKALARWWRRQVPLFTAGAATAGLLFATLAIGPGAVVWSVLAGVTAAVAAYLVAVPRGPRN